MIDIQNNDYLQYSLSPILTICNVHHFDAVTDLREDILACVVLESQRHFDIMWGRMDGNGLNMQHPSLRSAYCTIGNLCKYFQSFFKQLIGGDLNAQNRQPSR